LQSKANSGLPKRPLFKFPRLRKSQCATTASRISTASGTSPEDLTEHIHIENNILFPRFEA